MFPRFQGPPAPPAVSEELPLPPEYRAVFDELIARTRRWQAMNLIVTMMLVPLVGIPVSLLSGRNGWWIALLVAALVGGISGALLRWHSASLRRRAGVQTYLRSTGALRVIENFENSATGMYSLYVGQRSLALPEGANPQQLSLPVYNRNRRVDDGPGGLFPGSVDHSADDLLVFSINDPAGRTLYRHPSVPTRR